MSSQQRRQKRQRSQRRQRRQRGGDASNWAAAVYGQAGAQTAAPGGGNVIAANNLSGVNMCSGGIAANAAPIMGGSAASPPIVAVKGPSPAELTKGGRRRRQQQQQGGKGVLLDVAVPAVLLYANQAIKRRKHTMTKRHKKNFSRKFRRH